MSKEIQTMEDLFEHLLQDMYFAEKKITKALPKMAKKATNPELQKGFETHLKETEEQIANLEKVFEITDTKKKGEKCEAILGLIEEGEGLMKEAEKGEVLDEALIAAAQKVEHYEIASYGTLLNLANKLGYKKAMPYIEKILDQEKNTDVKLSKMADKIMPANDTKKAA